jgi:hypothetical protein
MRVSRAARLVQRTLPPSPRASAVSLGFVPSVRPAGQPIVSVTTGDSGVSGLLVWASGIAGLVIGGWGGYELVRHWGKR